MLVLDYLCGFAQGVQKIRKPVSPKLKCPDFLSNEIAVVVWMLESESNGQVNN